MERLKKPENKIRWENRGGGTFRMSDHRQIKPGEIFDADPRDVPPAFRSTIVPLDPLPETVKEIPVTTPLYFLQPRRARGWFDVVDKKGAAINQQALRKEEAEQLIQDRQNAEGSML